MTYFDKYEKIVSCKVHVEPISYQHEFSVKILQETNKFSDPNQRLKILMSKFKLGHLNEIQKKGN